MSNDGAVIGIVTNREREEETVKGVILAALKFFPPGERGVAFERISAAVRTELSKRDTQPVRMPDILGRDGER